MALLDVFNVSGSGMAAQTLRLNMTSSNIANAESVAENPEQTYRARYPVFQTQLASALGDLSDGSNATNLRTPEIVESDAPLNMRHEPNHPFANEEGYVAYPNVSVVSEMANMISASRSFQLNVEVMNTAKTLAERVLSLGQ